MEITIELSVLQIKELLATAVNAELPNVSINADDIKLITEKDKSLWDSIQDDSCIVTKATIHLDTLKNN